MDVQQCGRRQKTGRVADKMVANNGMAACRRRCGRSRNWIVEIFNEHGIVQRGHGFRWVIHDFVKEEGKIVPIWYIKVETHLGQYVAESHFDGRALVYTSEGKVACKKMDVPRVHAHLRRYRRARHRVKLLPIG